MRRLEIPDDMQKKYGFAVLGDANSATKQQIFSGNAARMYNIALKKAENTRMPAFSEDRFAALKKEYTLAVSGPGYVREVWVGAVEASARGSPQPVALCFGVAAAHDATDWRAP